MIEQLQSTVAILVIAAAVAAAIIAAILPLLRRHALTHPIARSSHRIPTPQGAGLGVVVGTIVAASVGLAMFQATSSLALVFAATAILAVVGAIDDVRPVPIVPRLVMQAVGLAVLLATVPDSVRILPQMPLLAERATLLVAGLWFVNLVNFMDGLDWITAAEIVPTTAALIVFGLTGHLSVEPFVVAAALCGAYLGFAPFNRPTAKVFLGDVGSLPTGLLLGWCLLDLAARGHLAAAVLLPLYYLADSTLTLFKRVLRGQKFWLAHREHFYQQATDNGLSVLQIVTRVFALNIVLAALAALTLTTSVLSVQVGSLAAGACAVAFTLLGFARGVRSAA